MVLNIIMAVCFYPVLFIMYFIFKHYSKFNDGRIFNCGMTYDHSQSDEIIKIQKSFINQMNLLFFVFLVIPIVTCFIKYDSIVVSFWIVWTMVWIAVAYVPFAIAHGKVIDIKRKNGWTVGEKNVVFVDTSTVGRIRTISIKDFIVPFIICLVSCVYTAVNISNSKYGAVYSIILSGSFTVCTLIMCWVSVVIDKKKSVVISRDSNVNVNYNRASKKIWKDFWMIVIYGSSLLTASVCFTVNSAMNVPVMFIASIAFTVVVCIMAIAVLSRKNKLNNSYKEYMTNDIVTDEDSNWIFGLLYYNPLDKHLMVEDKVGIGLTVNMATWLGKASVVLMIGVYALMTWVCGFVIKEEFTPINLHVENNVLICSQTSEKYKLDVNKISEVKVINNLPDLSKSNGTDMRALLKGNFVTNNHEKCNVLLNPENKKFIELKYDGKTYYLSDKDDKITEQIYNEIKK